MYQLLQLFFALIYREVKRMENILDDDPIESTTNRSNTPDDFDKELQNAANELEENLLGLFETSMNNDGKDNNTSNDNDDGMKADDNPFDLILPSVRLPDPRTEQKQRDRAKRKELRNKREAEEEEREKMQ